MNNQLTDREAFTEQMNAAPITVTVCCAPCDEGMYQALGFPLHLGNTYAKLIRL